MVRIDDHSHIPHNVHGPHFEKKAQKSFVLSEPQDKFVEFVRAEKNLLQIKQYIKDLIDDYMPYWLQTQTDPHQKNTMNFRTGWYILEISLIV